MSKKTIFFDEYCGYATSAVVENDKITEFNFERKDRASIIGNIYKGRVECVLQGMNAAFVNCGLERNCYLSAEDVFPDAGKYDGENGKAPALPELKEGDEILVQVTKAPVGKKGARVTAFPSFVGRHVIYMPRTPFIGVSRKISDGELRKNLIYWASKMTREDEGIVLRTAAPYARHNVLELEIAYLRNLYNGISDAFGCTQAGELLYTDVDLTMRVMRDTLSYDIEKIIVGTPKLERLIFKLNELYPPAYRRPVILHNSTKDMFNEYGLTEQITEINSPRVNLDNGAYLIIEKTEALTVIDVNTGKFTGEDNLEQTVYHTNILAAREIAMQVKLRNIGGIVVVDFIDMSTPSHRNAIVGELERALKQDNAKCAVSPMSKLGLVEFSRKRVGASHLSAITRPCRHCKSGLVLSPRFVILKKVRVGLLNMYAEGNRVLRFDANSEVLNEISDWNEFISDLKERMPDAEIYGAPHRSFPDEQVYLHCGNDIFPLPEKAVKII